MTYYNTMADQALLRGKIVDADNALKKASQLFETADGETTRARIAILALHAFPALPAHERHALYDSALHHLARAEQLNPFIPLLFYARGVLYEQNPEYAGSHGLQKAVDNYKFLLQLQYSLIKKMEAPHTISP